ncbi:hypothetical protein [Streptomyces sp. NPDC051561]|uniref:hypothetical protein n=1 Tax=Streptomyces sp. NPDC051561 TaxID=3365658 RepID=UPI0037991FE9
MTAAHVTAALLVAWCMQRAGTASRTLAGRLGECSSSGSYGSYRTGCRSGFRVGCGRYARGRNHPRATLWCWRT